MMSCKECDLRGTMQREKKEYVFSMRNNVRKGSNQIKALQSSEIDLFNVLTILKYLTIN